MNRITQFLKGSIINKAIFLIAIILLSVGGILAVNAISFFDVKDSLESMIDRDIRQVIENTRMNDNFISLVAESDLLLSTFTEHKNTLTPQKDRLIEKLSMGISFSMLTERDSKKYFENYIAALNKLFANCAVINAFLIEIDTIHKLLDTELTRLDEIVVEKELTAVVEGTEETDSIKQLAIMLPGYREIYFEVTLNFLHAKIAYLGSNDIDQNYEQKILGLLEEFDIGLRVLPIAWAEIKPRVQKLIELTSRHKSQINKTFISLRAFRDQREALRRYQKKVLAETSKINHQIVDNTHAIRKQTSANIGSSIRTTVMLSSIIIIILLVIGLFVVRLIQPIKKLSVGALEIGAGNLDYKVTIDSDDEIGHLAEAFNGMTDSLRKTTVSKEYVENILKSINEMLIILTPNGRIQSVNQATCDLLGYQAEELVGESADRVFEGAEDINVIDKERNPKSVIEKLVAQQAIKNNETTWWDKEGRALSVLFSASAIKDNNENLQGFVCVASDITERKQAEEALKISEANYRRLFDAEPDAIIITDSESKRIVDANPAALKLYGYSYDEICGLQAISLSAEPQKSTRHIQHILSEETMATTGKIVQRQHKSKEGTVFPVEIAHGFYIRNGRKMICAIMRNISRRKQMEDELAAEKERLSVTLRSIGDGVISTDLKGNVISVNGVAEELTGWKEEEAVGKPLTNVFHIVNELNRQLCEDPVRKVMETGGIVGLANNTILVSKDGKEHVIADSAAPIMDSQHKIIGAVLVFRDITAKRKIEEELVKIQKLESLGVLAGGIAHDFNNFLTAIIGNLSLAMLDSEPGDQVVARLKEMEKASLRAKDLTQQLLTFSKGGAPVKKLVNLADLVKHSATFSLRGSNVRCEFSVAENLLPAEVDEGQIGQVINNLVLNADHAMPEGGILEIQAENIVLSAVNEFSLPTGPYIKATFQDHGVGIPVDHLPKVFDPYFTTKHKGSGLGLTVAYSIIDKHNGRLTADSELGKQTVFTIYLPASEKLEIQTENKAKVLLSGGGKVLLMDDEDFIREIASQMLHKLGYEVSVARDGGEAIEIYRQAQKSNKPFDAVIMDLTVPGGMGGKEAIKKLKKLDPKIKALVSSGYSKDPIMSNFKDYGFKGVVKKPYVIQDISDALRLVITEKTK